MTTPSHCDPLTSHFAAPGVVKDLIRMLNAGGEKAAVALVAQLGSHAEIARELAYLLYTLCERKKRAAEALAYKASHERPR